MATLQTNSHETNSESPPKLDTSTLGLLENFLDQKKKEEVLFRQLKSNSSSGSTSRTRTATNSSSSGSSVSSRRRKQNKPNASLGQIVSDLLPRGRSGRNGAEPQLEDDEDSLVAQAEALADLERLNGVESSLRASALRHEVFDNEDESDASGDDSEDENVQQREPHQMDVDAFRRYFGEKWQLSQFWYTSECAYRIARHIYNLMTTVPVVSKKLRPQTNSEGLDKRTITNIAFICCPAAFVGFQFLYPNSLAVEPYLFEYDERFSLLAPPPPSALSNYQSRFVHYDLNDPLAIPAPIEGQFDLLILDPPYLNRDTNLKLAQTVAKLRRSEESKVLLITGESISREACEIYANERTGVLKKAEGLVIDHVGLKNDFGAWGNWDGVEEFGAEK